MPQTRPESQVWREATLGPCILLSAESWLQPCEGLVIFVVILLTQFSTQQRYIDIALDLQIKIPCKATPAAGVFIYLFIYCVCVCGGGLQ